MRNLTILLICGVFVVLAYATEVPKSNKEGDQAAGMPIYSADGALIPNPHMVTGIITWAKNPGLSVTLTGPAAFTSADTYQCLTTTGYPGPVAVPVAKIDGSHFKIPYGTSDPSSWVISYACIGN